MHVISLLIGFIGAVALLGHRPRLAHVALLSGLLGAATGEVVFLLSLPQGARPPSQDVRFWRAAILYYPYAVLAVGAWGTFVTAAALRAVEGRRSPISGPRVLWVMAAWILCGATVGWLFAVGLKTFADPERITGQPPLFSANIWRNAGLAAGTAVGLICAIWRHLHSSAIAVEVDASRLPSPSLRPVKAEEWLTTPVASTAALLVILAVSSPGFVFAVVATLDHYRFLTSPSGDFTFWVFIAPGLLAPFCAPVAVLVTAGLSFVPRVGFAAKAAGWVVALIATAGAFYATRTLSQIGK